MILNSFTGNFSNLSMFAGHFITIINNTIINMYNCFIITISENNNENINEIKSKN